VQLLSGDAHSKLKPGNVNKQLIGAGHKKIPKTTAKQVVQTSELMIDCYKDLDIEKKQQRKIKVAVSPVHALT
jgi:hypothetical protein